MNNAPITLNPQDHANAGWTKFTSYQFAGQDHLCPVQMAELTQVLPWYPMALVPTQETPNSPRVLVALLGTRPGQNLYVTPQGQWQAPYIPAHFRGYPFSLNKEGQVQINSQSGLMQKTAPSPETAFYTQDTESGQLQPSTALQQIHNFLTQCQQGLALTHKLTQQLQQHGLFEDWPIEFKNGQQTLKLQGIERISEPALRTLSGEAYQQLAHSGALGLAYAQIYSQARLADLQYRLQKTAQGQSPQAQDIDLDQVFGESSDDLFKF